MFDVRAAANFEADACVAVADLIDFHFVAVALAKRADRAHRERFVGRIDFVANWQVSIDPSVYLLFDGFFLLGREFRG